MAQDFDKYGAADILRAADDYAVRFTEFMEAVSALPASNSSFVASAMALRKRRKDEIISRLNAGIKEFEEIEKMILKNAGKPHEEA